MPTVSLLPQGQDAGGFQSHPHCISSDVERVADRASLQQLVLQVGGLQSGLICELLLRNRARSILYSFRPL